MSHIPSFHNRQSPNFSSFPYDSDPSMQRNQRNNNQNLEDLLDQLKRKEAGAENPFYDNSYQHKLNVHPARGQDPSLDLRSQQYPSLSRELDENPVNPEYEQREPVQRQARQEYAQPDRNQIERNQGQQGQVYRDYDKNSLQDNNKGSFWTGLGENNRHKNIVKEYQEYMRNNPIPPPKKGGRLDNSEPERNRAPLRKKPDQEKEWYSRDVGVGILPGMGGQESYGAGNRRSPEVQQDYRRGVSDIAGGNRNGYDIPSRMNQNPSGSRLAGIGSRLIEGERPYYDQMRTPQYTPNKGDMKFNFASPQDHNRRSVEMAGYSNEMDRYSREGVNRQPEPILEVEEHNNQQGGVGNEERWQNPGKQVVRDRRAKENGGGNEGMSWVEERQRQEQDKKNRQREDLQRIYREQIEEKKRKKEEEQRIKMLEDQKEEERLRKENEDLQRQFLMEQVKKKEQDNVKGKGEEIMDKDYIAARKRQNKHRAFEVSEASPMGRGNVRVQEQEYEQPEPREENRMIYEQVGVDDMIRETAKRYEEQLNMNMRPRYEFTRDPELEVHREFTRKINATLDEELEKMRKDVDYHSKLIRNELTSYKTQAMVTQELRENAHRELQRLKEELKNQQIMEERRPYDDFEFPAENPQQNFDRFAKSKEQDFDRPDYKIGHQMPLRNYAKSFSPDNDGPDLGGTSAGMDLDFDTNYVPARDAGRIEARLFREPPKLNDLMNKYGVDDDATQVQQKKDLAMKKFGSLFPEHGGKAQSQDSLAALEARLGNNTKQMSNQGSTAQQSRSYKGNYDAVEGEDEIERIENLLKRYKEESVMKEKQEGKGVKREVLQDYKKYEQALVKEFGEEGFGGNGSFGFAGNGYVKDEEDLEENEGETPAKSEVELANVTHEVSIAEDRSDIRGR